MVVDLKLTNGLEVVGDERFFDAVECTGDVGVDPALDIVDGIDVVRDFRDDFDVVVELVV